jgi:hypothetical protein
VLEWAVGAQAFD